jgi:hypothetical protein
MDWDPSKSRPNLFRFDVPEQAILEEQSLTKEDISRSVALHLSVIPLEVSETTPEIIIERFHFQYEGFNLEVPSLHIRVVPQEAISAVDMQKTDQPLETSVSDHLPLQTVSPSFPKIHPQIPHLFKNRFDKIVDDAESLWNTGKISESLALIRKTERDSIFGFAFVSLRQEMDRSLGLIIQNEPKIPKNLLFFCTFLAASCVICIIYKIRKKKWEVFSMGGFMLLSLLLIFLFVILYAPKSKNAVLRGTDDIDSQERSGLIDAYYVPNGTISEHFNEGQSAIIRSVSDSWVYIETADKAGWVELGAVIFY